MSLSLMIIVTAIYLFVMIDQFWLGHIGQGIMFAGYAIANLGLMKIV